MLAAAMEDWTKIFKALGNDNRLQILRLLLKRGELPVREISDGIKMNIKNTSKHLIILANLNFLDATGKRGSVWYRIHPALRKEVGIILRKFVCR